MSRINCPHIDGSDIEPNYPDPKTKGGLSIVLYSCAKGQKSKEVSE